MNPVSIGMLAIAMSTDAFAAAVGKGAALDRPRLAEALRSGAIFGSIEATTPLIGWALGIGAASYVRAFDHWIAFALLGGIGLWMIRAGLDPEVPDEGKATRHSFWMLAATGLGTSIDAMAVGVGLAFVDVNIAWVAVAIGCATFVMVTGGIMLGRALGTAFGKRSEIAGGVILIGIGVAIVYEHLHGG